MTEIKKNQQRDEEIIRSLLQKSKIETPENLQHRIMRTVETNASLTPKKTVPIKENTNVLADFRNIFGIMYLVLIAVSAGSYFAFGIEFLKSSTFIFAVIGIAFIFSLFWLITQLDLFLRERKRKKHISQ